MKNEQIYEVIANACSELLDKVDNRKLTESD